MISNVLAASLSQYAIDRFASFSAVIGNLWNVLSSIDLLKLRSAVLRTPEIGKRSLKWTQLLFTCMSTEIDQEVQRQYFAAMQVDVHKARYPFYSKRNLSIPLDFTANVTRNALR